MKLIVGLGNPGKKYEKTRHNAGFMAMDHLADFFDLEKFKQSDKHKCAMTMGQIDDEKVILIKPQTFMNLSGQAAKSVANFHKLGPHEVIVIYDDVDIPQGILRVRTKGSAGGHNGLKSIIQELGTQEFIRIRLGIAPLIPFKGELNDYVLGKMSQEEENLMKENIKRLPRLIAILLEGKAEEAMQEFN